MKKFTINISPAIRDDLRYRLALTRWPDQIGDTPWAYGADLHYLQSLCEYWLTHFDWQQQEDRLNQLDHFKLHIKDIDLHFIHEKGKGPDAVPLLLIHGFPDSFVRFLKIIPLLTTPDKNGRSFDLIIPSIPGFGFSGIPEHPGMGPAAIAAHFHKLMTKTLGYDRYFVHGGDWGSTITEQLAIQHGDHLQGIHLTDIPFRHILQIPTEELTEEEKQYLEAGKKWQEKEGAYAMLQSTKPQTPAYGLNDSPAGLAAWIIEKFQLWSDNKGDLENSFTKDELLTNLTIYWATQTINAAMRIYFETMHEKPAQAAEQPLPIPTGLASFPKDLAPPPKSYADRFFNMVHWTDMPRGGHFAAMEEPELLAADIRAFVNKVLDT